MVRLADSRHPREGASCSRGFLSNSRPMKQQQQLLTSRERNSCRAIWKRIFGPTQNRNVMIYRMPPAFRLEDTCRKVVVS